MGGLKLDVGAFNPIQLPGRGSDATKYLRPEPSHVRAPVRRDRQARRVRKRRVSEGLQRRLLPAPNRCVLTSHPARRRRTASAAVFASSWGPLHLGLAGDYGKGTGLNYALESSDAAQDQQGNLRIFDAYYAQLQLVLGRFDLFTGAGIERVFLTDFDKAFMVPDPRDR